MDGDIDINPIKIIKLFYENEIKKYTGIDIYFKLVFKYETNYIDNTRCLARIWDLHHNNRYPNINKRCANSVFGNLPLCKMHLKKNTYGLITEYPDTKMLNCYLKVDKNIQNKINTNLNNKKNFYIKKRDIKQIMSLNSIDYTKEILDYKNINSNIDSNEIYLRILEKYGRNIGNITLSEKDEILNKLDHYSKLLDCKENNLRINYKINIQSSNILKVNKIETDKININILEKDEIKKSKIDLFKLDNIKLLDSDYNSCDLYLYQYKDNIYLLNNQKKVISLVKEWIDEDDEVPTEYKNADNRVLDPIKRLPIIEILIDKKAAIFCNINDGLYREYEYDETLESFRSTNNILRS